MGGGKDDLEQQLEQLMDEVEEEHRQAADTTAGDQQLQQTHQVEQNVSSSSVPDTKPEGDPPTVLSDTGTDAAPQPTLLSEVLQEVCHHPQFKDFCDWCNSPEDDFTQCLDEHLDRELSRWFGYVVTRNIDISGKIEKHKNMIMDHLPDDPPPCCHPNYQNFRRFFKTRPKTGRLPFTSLHHVKDDLAEFEAWCVKDAEIAKKDRRLLSMAMSHFRWPQYVQKCIDQGADEQDYCSLDSLVEGDPDATLEDFNDFISNDEWAKEDIEFGFQFSIANTYPQFIIIFKRIR